MNDIAPVPNLFAVQDAASVSRARSREQGDAISANRSERQELKNSLDSVACQQRPEVTSDEYPVFPPDMHASAQSGA